MYTGLMQAWTYSGLGLLPAKVSCVPLVLQDLLKIHLGQKDTPILSLETERKR